MRFQVSKLISQDMSENFVLDITDIIAMVPIAAAIQCAWTGSAVGSLKLQAKCHPTAPFTELAATRTEVNGASDALWDLGNMGYKFLQLVYTKTSGSGSMDIFVNTKGGL